MMNKYKYYLFDLDGTISESALGIRESLENAIKSMGKPLPNLDDYTLYIGPPLLDTFRNICRFNEEESARGVEIYREYYNTKSKLVNTTEGLKATENGLLETNEYGETTVEGIFASGDVVLGAKTVVEAVAYSKVVAEAMDRYMQNKDKECNRDED